MNIDFNWTSVSNLRAVVIIFYGWLIFERVFFIMDIAASEVPPPVPSPLQP